MSRMFSFEGKPMVVWNLFTGCNFQCSYCWARKLAETKLKASYPYGFIPTTHFDRFYRRFKPDDFVFPITMGDIAFAPSVIIQHILKTADKFPYSNFLLCSKSPSMFCKPEFHRPNIFLGTTIETNRKYEAISKAPPVTARYHTIRYNSSHHKFVSIEPIMDFDLLELVQWMVDIKPEIIEVGADNYHNNLPEPSPDKVNALLVHIRQICPTVIEKEGLERLK